MRLIFVLDTLEFLHRGGRIGGAQRFIGSMLAIKPLLHLEDGKVESLASVRTKRKAIKHMLDVFEDEVKGSSNVRAAVLNTLAMDEAEKVVAEVKQRINPVELSIVDLSPVIGTHVGPGAVGVIYYVDN
jgi:DegV family protein with EDD domain